MTPANARAGWRFARLPHARELEPCPHEGSRLVEEIVASVREHLPEFAGIPVDEFRRMAASDIRRGQAAISEQRLPTREELDAAAAVTIRLARAGIPLEAVNESRRLAVRHVFEAWRDRAKGHDVAASVQVEYLYALWNLTDAIAATAAAAYREVEVEVEGTGEEQRAWFLRGLLDGTLSAAEAQGRAPAYGLLPGARYLALRGRSSPAGDARQLQRAVEQSGGNGDGGALVAIVDGDLWGVAARPPRIDPADGVVALGMPAELGDLTGSFGLAGRALETAAAFGLAGVVSIDDLSLRPAILSEEHLGERLVRRYLEPLRELGEFGTTLERTLREYLASGMRIDDSAKALIIHPNTLRHRIDRFQQLTGADLRRTEDMVEVWWALERRKVSPG